MENHYCDSDFLNSCEIAAFRVKDAIVGQIKLHKPNDCLIFDLGALCGSFTNVSHTAKINKFCRETHCFPWNPIITYLHVFQPHILLAKKYYH